MTHQEKLHLRFAAAFLSALATFGPFVRGTMAAVDERPLTVAEQSDYRATSRYEDDVALLDRLDATAKHVTLFKFGESVEGRSLMMAAAAEPHVESPEDLTDDERLVVLLLGNIHPGECAGKEALLKLLRDIATQTEDRLSQELVLLFVPNYNPDGNERRGAHHRPGQIGPDKVGLRTNAQGLDLNRDFVKLDSPEARALVRLVNNWNPHVLIDTHTTNGSRHRYALTYDAPRNPAAAAGPREFLRTELLPAVTRRLQADEVDTFFYGNFNADHSRWTTFGAEPRYSIEYAGLRGRLGILSEAYSYLPYRRRIDVTYQFVTQCLVYLSENRQRVRQLVDTADAEAVAAGQDIRVGDLVPIRSEVAALPDKVVIMGYQRPANGGHDGHRESDSREQETPQPQDYTVDYYGRFQPTLQVQRPFAYLLLSDQSRAVDRLLMHGIRVEQLNDEMTLDLEIYQIEKLQRADKPFQKHPLVEVEVTSRQEQQTVARGTYVVRTSQPLGNLAVYLLEAASDDGLVTWNFFDHALLEGADHPVRRVPAATELPTVPVTKIEPAQRLTVEQIFGPEREVPFSGARLMSVRWLPDSEQFSQRNGRYRVRVDAKTGAVESLLDREKMTAAFAALPAMNEKDAEAIAGRTNQRSPDGEAVLVTFAGDLFYYRQDEGDARRLTDSPQPERYATFSPDGAMLAFVREHNLYLVEVATGRQRALTTEGTSDVFLGELDWVYQEELYGRGNFKGFWWSPDSRRIALLRIDQSPVHSYTVTDHIPYRQQREETRYPKAGDPLPHASLGVVRAAGGEIRWVDHYQYGAADHLIVRVGWTDDSRQICYQVQNRQQSWLDLRTADAASGESKKLLRETSPAWVEVLGHPTWLPDGSFLWLSDRSGARHIYHVSKDGQTARAVTAGPWDVRSLHGIDDRQNWIYFTATKDSATATHCYRVKLDGSHLTRITDGNGSHRARFNDRFTYFFDSYSQADQPPRTQLLSADGTPIRMIEPNLVDHLPYYHLGAPEFVEVPARDGVPLQARLIKPPDFDPEKKYPVLCYIYSGPQAPAVWNRWQGDRYLWHQMLAQHGYCIWVCDNRSAASRGIKNTWPIHLRTGKAELEDIEDGLNWLKQQPWIDGERIGLWGWSYGGYMTSYALTHSESFKMGIAGAPVTDWRNYDAIYTERYMGLPQDNPDGYRDSSVVAAADQLHGRLLLIHGTQDDNVHLANTMQLVNALQRAGKQFDLMIYPKNRHGITDPRQSRHLRELMTRFVLENL